MSFVSDTLGIPVIAAPSDVPRDGSMFGQGYERRDRTIDPEGGFARAYTGPVFSRQEIIERLKDREKTKQRTFDRMAQKGVKPLNQSNTNFCWANAACDAIQVQRVLMGDDHVPLSAASIACLVTNYANAGGWPLKALRKGAEVGWCPVEKWPANGISRNYDTAESRAARAPFKVSAEGWLDLPANNWDVVFTRLVLGDPVTLCHMEWSHAVLAIDAGIASNGELMALCRNSGYGRDNTGHSWVKESFGLPDDALAVQVVTAG